jgi:hypothetical protein
MGAWFTCLSLLNYMAVLSNCYLLCIVTKDLHNLIPSRFQYILASDYSRFFYSLYFSHPSGRFVLLVILEHILLIFKVILSVVIVDVPREVEMKQAKEIKEQKEKAAAERLLIYKYPSFF